MIEKRESNFFKINKKLISISNSKCHQTYINFIDHFLENIDQFAEKYGYINLSTLFIPQLRNYFLKTNNPDLAD